MNFNTFFLCFFSSTVIMSVKDQLMTEVAEPLNSSGNKVTIVGIGQVGMACAFSILTQSVSSEVVLVDVMEDKLRGEMLDLQHGTAFMKNARIDASTGNENFVGKAMCIAVCVLGKKGREKLQGTEKARVNAYANYLLCVFLFDN